MTYIFSFSEVAHSGQSADVLKQLEAIFFSSSSRQLFNSETERSQFRFKYLDWYRIHYPDLMYVVSNAQGEILGYICGVPDTSEASDLFEMHPWFELLTTHFKIFPAHLHINLSDAARGLGIGSRLIGIFEKCLKSRKISGVHLVTSPDARNVGFYRKNGYTFEKVFHWKKAHMLFMGKHL